MDNNQRVNDRLMLDRLMFQCYLMANGIIPPGIGRVPAMPDAIGGTLGQRSATQVVPPQELTEEGKRAGQVLELYSKSVLTEADKAQIEALVQQGVNPNQEDKRGKALITHAVRSGHTEVVRMLLARDDVDVNQMDGDGFVLLHEAGSKGHVEIVKMLLAKDGIDVNKPDRAGCIPLFCPAELGHTEIIQLLLAVKGMDINLSTRSGTPLHRAANRGHVEIVKMFLSHKNADEKLSDLKIQDWQVWLSKYPKLEPGVIVSVLIETGRLTYDQMLSRPMLLGYWVRHHNNSKISIDWNMLTPHTAQMVNPNGQWFIRALIGYQCTAADARVPFLEALKPDIETRYAGADTQPLVQYMETYLKGADDADACLLVDFIISILELQAHEQHLKVSV